MSKTDMEIDLWSGDWGLPTIEQNCLQVLTLIRFSNAPVAIHYTNNPFNTPDGYLPTVRYLKRRLRNFEDIRILLITKNYCPDVNMNSKQVAESYALRKMIEEKLYPALRFTWWLDTKNYEKVTRPWYANALSFPFNFYYPKRYRRENEDAIHGLYGDLEELETELQIYREAEKCLTFLSHRLGENDNFFYGSNPSSLDAFVYGYLAPLIRAPLPSNVLQNHAKACLNLCQFVDRITRNYFRKENQEYEEKRRKEAAPKQSENSSDFFPNRLRNQILAAIFAIGASLTFGFYHGLVTISPSNGKDSESYVEYEMEESSN